METQGQPIVVHRDQWAPDHLALLCGIANAGGGVFIIDTGGKGYTSGLRKMRRPFEQIPRLAEKELGLECPTEPVLDGASLCLEVTVPAAERPIAYEGVYWLYDMGRNAKSSREAVQAVLDRTAPQRAAGRTTAGATDPWEMRQQPLAQQQDMNAGEFLAIASLETGEPDLLTESLDVVFEKRVSYLNLKHPQTRALTNAGVLLLHNQPERFIPGASVRLELFAQGDEAVLQNDVTGPLKHQLNEALRLLYEQYLPMAEATPGVAENPATALEAPAQQAMRGALLCALAHKDYECGRPLALHVHPDRIDLICPSGNAGGGSEGLTEILDNALVSEAASRNPILVNALRLMGVMDDWSESFEHLTARCAENGWEPPAVQQDSNGILIAFPLEAAAGRSDKEPPPQVYFSAPEQPAPSEPAVQRKGSIAGLGSSVPKNAPFSVRSIAAANNLDLTSTDEYVLRVLHTNGRATAVRIANVLGVSESTVRRSFRKLREHGFIERIGSDKAGYWRVLN